MGIAITIFVNVAIMALEHYNMSKVRWLDFVLWYFNLSGNTPRCKLNLCFFCSFLALLWPMFPFYTPLKRGNRLEVL